MTEKAINKLLIYAMQILFVCGISFGSKSIDFENTHNWATIVARYVVYISVIRGTQEGCLLLYKSFQSKSAVHLAGLYEQIRIYLLIFLVSIAILIYSKQRVLGEDFLFLFIAYLIHKYPEMERNTSMINYGTGMAYSFFEGYLAHVIPSDGARFVGFEENIDIFEDSQGVVFPVKRLFIVITKSLFCPPDLKHFNKKNRQDLPSLEACQSFEDVVKDVAGVKNRTYRNSAYCINRPGKEPVYIAVECATPLHTLFKVLQKKTIFKELMNVNVDEIVADFCSTLRNVIEKSPDCKDKCELVYYNDEDKNQNLADILLEKIRELEPNFENITRE